MNHTLSLNFQDFRTAKPATADLNFAARIVQVIKEAQIRKAASHIAARRDLVADIRASRGF